MTPVISERVLRAALSGLFTPSAVFTNNAGLLSLSQFYTLLSNDEIQEKLKGISLLQEEVFIYREKFRTVYRLEVEEKLKIDITTERHLLNKKTDNLLTDLLKKYNLTFSLWDIKHKFTEWPTARGNREIEQYMSYLYMKYQPR